MLVFRKGTHPFDPGGLHGRYIGRHGVDKTARRARMNAGFGRHLGETFPLFLKNGLQRRDDFGHCDPDRFNISS